MRWLVLVAKHIVSHRYRMLSVICMVCLILTVLGAYWNSFQRSDTYPCGHQVPDMGLDWREHHCSRSEAMTALTSLWFAVEEYKVGEGDYPSSLSLIMDNEILPKSYLDHYRMADFTIVLEPEITLVAYIRDGTVIAFYPPDYFVIQGPEAAER